MKFGRFERSRAAVDGYLPPLCVSQREYMAVETRWLTVVQCVRMLVPLRVGCLGGVLDQACCFEV